MKKYIIVIGAVFCFSFSLREYVFNTPTNWPEPFYNFNQNQLTENKVNLGRVLFFDPFLSADNTISCASCHSPYSAFTHVDHALSHGIHDSIGTRNSPALMNLAWQKSFMWDGAINNLDMQALAPITHAAEMGSSIQEVIAKLNGSVFYKQLFYDAFGDSTATGEHTLKSIAQFLLTLVSAESKYDKVMEKQETFSIQEANGYKLFKANCESCHREPLFTNDEFANNGLKPDSLLGDVGRMHVTTDAKDSLKFKVPTLRNIEFTYPYMHDGRFNKLSEVLNHYNTEIHSSETLAPELKNGIDLSSEEKVDLISFLLTLSDKKFIFNPNNQFPKELLTETLKNNQQ